VTEDTRLHDRWAAACGGTGERRAALVWHLIGRVAQPAIESQTTERFRLVGRWIAGDVTGWCDDLEPSEVAAWLAAVGLGEPFENWADRVHLGDENVPA
jgi:hypothetical protein